MDASIVPSQSEILEAIREAMAAAPPSSEPGMTVNEIGAAIGRQPRMAREYVRTLIAEGRMTVTRVRRPALDGRMSLVPGYRLT